MLAFEKHRVRTFSISQYPRGFGPKCIVCVDITTPDSAMNVEYFILNVMAPLWMYSSSVYFTRGDNITSFDTNTEFVQYISNEITLANRMHDLQGN